MNRVLKKIAKLREKDYDDIPASHVRTLICDEIEADAIADEKERKTAMRHTSNRRLHTKFCIITF